MASLCIVATLGLATATHAAESNLDFLDPIGKSPARPFRAAATGVCADNICDIKFGKVPKNSILIFESVMCSAKATGDVESDGASVTTSKGVFLGIVPPTLNPNIKLLANAYLPFKAGEAPLIKLSGASGQVGICTVTGRLLPTD